MTNPARPLLASFAVRQGAATALIVLVAVALFGWSALAAIDASLRRDLLHTIDTDVAGLVDIAAQGGRGELVHRIGDRVALEDPSRGRAYYRLTDAAGRRLAGNLGPLPGVDPRRSPSLSVTIAGDPTLLRATRLAGGVDLVVGRSLAADLALERRLASRLAVAAIVAIAAPPMLGLVACGSTSQPAGLPFRRLRGPPGRTARIALRSAPGQPIREPGSAPRSGRNRTTPRSSSRAPRTSTSDMNGPIWRGGKLTTAVTSVSRSSWRE